MSENRTLFQIERLAFFSDAVIAIAITLLTLEVKIPDFKIAPSPEEKGEIITGFIAVAVCFLTIGDLWMKHHKLFEHVSQINDLAIRMNLAFLLGIIILPLNTSLLYRNAGDMRIVAFFSNLFCCSLLFYILIRVVTGKGHHFTSELSKTTVIKLKRRSLINSIIFLLVCCIGFINADYYFLPFVIYPITWVRGFGKKKK
jgi:uncharacterized membrane protein